VEAPNAPSGEVRRHARQASTYTPGRVQQIPGESGYAFLLPTGTTLQTTVTAPTLSCNLIPVSFRNEQIGVQNTLEIAGEYIVEQSWCTGGAQVNQVNLDISNQGYNPVGFGVTGPVTLTETITASGISGTISEPRYTNNWTVPGTFTTSSAYVGMLDNTTYLPSGGIVPYTPIPFTSTTVNGQPLGSYLDGAGASGGVEQNSVFGADLQDQSSLIGGGSSFTITNSNLTLPGTSAGDVTTPMPASSDTVVDVPVTVSAASTYPIYVDYATSDGTAVGNVDYTPTSGTLLFTPGQTTATVPVTILTGRGGPDLSFALNLSSPSFTVATGNAVVTLTAVNVDAVDPSSGLPQGGNQVTITGNGFTGTTAVSFVPSGGTPVDATGFTVDSDTQMTVTVPDLAGPLGSQASLTTDVLVTAGVSESPAVGTDQYTVVPLEVTGVSPGTGPVNGGTDLTVEGSGFTGVTTVTFKLTDGTELTATPTPVSDTQLTVTAPAVPASVLSANAEVANLLVTVDDDGVTATSPTATTDEFRYLGPQVDGLSQLSGPLAGGTGLTITGTGFTGATGVVFHFPGATDVTVPANASSDTSTTVTTPATPAGDLVGSTAVADVEVVVAAGNGTTATSPPTTPGQIIQFTFQGPAVGSLSQASGPLAGGTTVTVSGQGFTGTTAVIFRFADTTTLSVPASTSSDTSVTVTTPAVSADELVTNQAVADVEVQVAAGGGMTATSGATPPDQFAFGGPSVSGVGPNKGPMQGGTQVTVSGSGFTGTTAVLFHLSDGTSLRVPASTGSDTSVTLATPAVSGDQLVNDRAVVDVEVEVAAAGATTATSPATPGDQFTFDGPSVSKLSIKSGPVQGGTKVVITGSNLGGASVVGFRTPGGTDFTVAAGTVSASSVTAVTPALPGTVFGAGQNAVPTNVEVEVPTTDGSIAVSPDTTKAHYTFTGPTVSKVSPSKGLDGIGLTVTGKNLNGASQVDFTAGGVTYHASPSAVTATSVKLHAPTVAAGILAHGAAVAKVQVAVALPSSTTALSPPGKKTTFKYLGPTATSVGPASGPVGGGTLVTVTGSNLTGVDQVTITMGSTVLRAVPTKVFPKSVTFVTPPLPAGLLSHGTAHGKVQVDLPTPAGTTLVSAVGKADRYTYLGPTTTAVSPTSGPSTGGTPVKVTGKELSGASSVKLTIGAASLTVPVTAATSTSVDFTSPAIPPGDLHNKLAVAHLTVVVAAAAGTSATSPYNKKVAFTFHGP
jgi:hypothetical protein